MSYFRNGNYILIFLFQHPELLVASYNQNEGATQDPDGVALIWNMKFNKQTPEYVFHHQVLIDCVYKYRQPFGLLIKFQNKDHP